MSDTKQLTLPITGMTCANCVATVERNLKKLDGVQNAMVTLSSERAIVEFEPAKLKLADMIARVDRAGYGVATGEADIIIKRLADDNDARRLEKVLSALEGVLEAQVNYTTEKARVKYVPTIVSQAELRRAVVSAGVLGVGHGGGSEKAREEKTGPGNKKKSPTNTNCPVLSLIPFPLFTVPRVCLLSRPFPSL